MPLSINPHVQIDVYYKSTKNTFFAAKRPVGQVLSTKKGQNCQHQIPFWLASGQFSDKWKTQKINYIRLSLPEGKYQKFMK